MSLISQLSEAVRGVNNQVGRCLFCGSECRLHHLADGDRVECLKCGYKSPVDVFALRKHNRLARIHELAMSIENSVRHLSMELVVEDAKTMARVVRGDEG